MLSTTSKDDLDNFKFQGKSYNYQEPINIIQHNIWEESDANAGLKFSVFWHVFIILSTCAIIVFDLNLVSVYKSGKQYTSINFSLLSFNIKYENTKRKFKYYCFLSEEESSNFPSTNDLCTIIPECSDLKVQTYYMIDEFGITCDIFYLFGIIGLIVRIIFFYKFSMSSLWV